MNYNRARQRDENAPFGPDVDDTEVLSAKATLTLKINALIASHGLTEAETAALAEMTPGRR